MFIKEVKNFNEYEADLIISDGTYEILCYFDAFPPIKNIEKGTNVKGLSTFLAEDIIRADRMEYAINKKEDFYSYQLQGEVLSIDKPIIGIGDIKLELDAPLPGDIAVGEYVQFNVMRLDCLLN